MNVWFLGVRKKINTSQGLVVLFVVIKNDFHC